MLINVDKIIVKNRIRKDFGDISELAMDIQDNGLISPIVINKDYVLLAGERRLRAIKRLGWTQVEVRMMDTRDAEHELNIEISENDVRKAFSKSERVDYMYRLMRIEQEKARERQGERTDICQKSDKGSSGRADETTAEQFGISRDTMRKEMTIVENKDLLDPKDFAEWDEGKLSTNKAFQKIKAELATLKQQNSDLDAANKMLAHQANQSPKIIEREVEVVPDDYASSRAKAKAYDADIGRKNRELEEAYRQRNELEEQIKELQAQTIREQTHNDTVASAIYFTAQCGSFIRDVGGYVWLADKLNELPDRERELYVKSALAIRDWALVLLQNIERSDIGREQIGTLGDKG